MRSKIEMRYKIHRMIEVLYSLELMDWNPAWDATWYAAWDAACDAYWEAYYKRLNEVRNEI